MFRLWRLCVLTIAADSTMLLTAQDGPLVTNLNLAMSSRFGVTVTARWVAAGVDEPGQGADLNGDGDRQDDNVLHIHDLATGNSENLQLCAAALLAFEHWLTFTVTEKRQGEDLNGDGDTWDHVVHVRNLESGETQNLRLAGSVAAVSDPWLALVVSEHEQSADLNGDGDTEDSVVHLHDLRAGETSNLGLASLLSIWGTEPPPMGLSRDWLAFSVYERRQSVDLDGDGDTWDQVVHLRNLESGETVNLGLAGDGIVGLSGQWVAFSAFDAAGPPVLHLHDLNRSETFHLQVRPCHWDNNGALVPLFALSEHWLAVSAREYDVDLNGDADQNDCVVHVRNLQSSETTNLGVNTSRHRHLTVHGKWLVFDGYVEPVQKDDRIQIRQGPLQVHDLETGMTTDLEMAGGFPAFARNRMAFSVQENAQREDLNADGDIRDSVLHVHEFSSGQTSNLELSGYPVGFWENWLVFWVSERRQGSNLFAVDLGTFERSPLRGDCDGDGDTNLADVVCLVNVLFPGLNLLARRSAALPCASERGNVSVLDTSGNGRIDVADVVGLANALFERRSPSEPSCELLTPEFGCPENPACW